MGVGIEWVHWRFCRSFRFQLLTQGIDIDTLVGNEDFTASYTRDIDIDTFVGNEDFTKLTLNECATNLNFTQNLDF